MYRTEARRTILLTLSLSLWALIGRAQDPLPCRFVHELVTLRVPLPCEDTLRFYLDTGGIDALYRSGRRRICPSKHQDHLVVAESAVSNGIPWPAGLELQRIKESERGWDGMLGRGWFREGRWCFDYAGGTLTPVAGDKVPAGERIPLGRHQAANTAGPMLRIPVTIDGDTTQLLFDTGARFIDESSVPRATSFITDSLFTKWRGEHPEWSIIPAADHSLRPAADQIVVPMVTVGSRSIGPVVFTVRAKENFEVLSRHFMDRPVVGALGANALSQLGTFDLDMPAAQLVLIGAPAPPPMNDQLR